MMTRWWDRVEPKIVWRTGQPMSEIELNQALAMLSDESPAWRALMQLIETAETNANENAAATIDPPTVLAGYVGGASHLRMLREELVNRRDSGLQSLSPG
jgi:hypothetical protein